MKRYYQYMIDKNDEAITSFLESRVMDETRREYGGFKERFVDVKQTVYVFSYMAAAYTCEESSYHQSNKVKGAMNLMLDYFNRELRSSNTFDFMSCNFSSAPDTAFCLEKLVPAYKLIQHSDLDIVLNKLYALIRKMAIGVMNGGFHTPNHRWAISSALLLTSQIIDDKTLVNTIKHRVDQYLNEGIDCNEDGEYAERSSGNYNAVVNRALISLYEITGEEKYLEYIKRNLDMMLKYFDPDDTIFTENSTRQDKGTEEYGFKYFFQYLYVAKENPIFNKAASKLIIDSMKRNEFPNFLCDILLRKELLEITLEDPDYPKIYNKQFKDSGIVRFRNDNLGYTLLKNAKHFLIIKYKDMKIPVHIGVSMCHTRYFEIQEITPTEDGYELKFNVDGWYYTPFKDKQPTSDWWEMDHSKRELLITSTLEIKVKIKHMDNGISLSVDTSGYKSIPIRLEAGIPDGCVLENEHLTTEATAGNFLLLKKGNIRAQGSNSACTIENGFFEHNFMGHMTKDNRDADHFSLVMTGYTPVNQTVTIEFEDRKWMY